MPTSTAQTIPSTSELDYFMSHSDSFPSSTYNHHHLLRPHPHHPPSFLDAFDPAFRVPTTEALGPLPPPVAYEDFQPRGFHDQLGSSTISPLAHTLWPAPPDLSQIEFGHQPDQWPDMRPGLHPTPLLLPPLGSNSVPATGRLVHPSPAFPYHETCHHPSQVLPSSFMSTCPSRNQINPDQSSSSSSQTYYPTPTATKIATPPPLFDPSEHDLFSSFLNIFGDYNGEWDFDPQGMPEDMPVLGELKRRLEIDGPSLSAGEEMEQQVEERLRITDPEPCLASQQKRYSVTAPQLDRKSEDEPVGRKKAKVKDQTLQTQPTAQLSIPSSSHPDDIEMSHVNDQNEWHSASPPLFAEPHPPPPPASTVTHSIPNETNSTNSEPKIIKATHVVSEQRRRNAIQGGFGALVDILRAGEKVSGISIGLVTEPEQQGASKGSKAKVSGRGRGRRGEIDTGASKSVVLERAVEYVKWMSAGNRALLEEVERVEGLVRGNV